MHAPTGLRRRPLLLGITIAIAGFITVGGYAVAKWSSARPAPARFRDTRSLLDAPTNTVSVRRELAQLMPAAAANGDARPTLRMAQAQPPAASPDGRPPSMTDAPAASALPVLPDLQPSIAPHAPKLETAQPGPEPATTPAAAPLQSQEPPRDTADSAPPAPPVAPVPVAQEPMPAPLTPSPTAAPDPTPPPRAEPVDVAPPPSVPAPERQAAPMEPAGPKASTAGLIARAASRLQIGDIAGARLYLQRAAELGSGSAARLLGSTYEESWLSAHGARGIAADPVRARAWHEKARALGVVALPADIGAGAGAKR